MINQWWNFEENSLLRFFSRAKRSFCFTMIVAMKSFDYCYRLHRYWVKLINLQHFLFGVKNASLNTLSFTPCIVLFLWIKGIINRDWLVTEKPKSTLERDRFYFNRINFCKIKFHSFANFALSCESFSRKILSCEIPWLFQFAT